MSITTLDAGMARTLEPRAAAPWRRLEAVRSLTDAGVPVGVLVAPVIPFINDDSMEHILQESKAAGAHYASYTVLRLPWEVKTLFEDWLNVHFPDRAQRVLHRVEDLRNGRRNDPNFGTRMRGTGVWADLLRQRFAVATRKLGLNRHRLALDCDRFLRPAGAPGSAGTASDFLSPVGAQASSGVPFPAARPVAGGARGRGMRQLHAAAAGQLSLFD
jgi:DNA repair photolyase